MTDRLYYSDSYSTVFDAIVLAAPIVDGRPALVLDRTLFYPTSGGQPNDTGVLADQPVIDVQAVDGTVLHVLGGAPTVAVGQRVQGTVDGAWRYDHMQQHSGQHLLSQLLARTFGYETVAVHFGAVESTLDLDAAAVEPEQIAAAEEQANALAYTALPIKAYFVGDRELSTLPLRRPPKVTGQIRIVEIDGYDYSACGGTHVRTTAEIAPIKILRQERRRGQTRLTFVSGLRACQDYAERHRLLVAAANLFSNDVSAVPTLVQRLIEQNRELQRQVENLTEQLAGYELAGLLAAAPTVGATRVVQQLYADRSVDALKHMGAQLRGQPQTVALLATTVGGKLTLLFVRSDDVDIHMGNLLRETLQAFGGGGGGRAEFAQGGGVACEQAQAVLEFAVEEIFGRCKQ